MKHKLAKIARSDAPGAMDNFYRRFAKYVLSDDEAGKCIDDAWGNKTLTEEFRSMRER